MENEDIWLLVPSLHLFNGSEEEIVIPLNLSKWDKKFSIPKPIRLVAMFFSFKK